ncbi:flagellar basal body rod protein FlgC [Endozoicomonas sp. OPT23]|uniref:flagellar basal body rod protein FlgC n=1 Tax=Endozoicomonas sp. OPT23 TaxID=2072845 RepID=UPI00129A373E|nr:flagellar basal body rod protein FlgC [Endozoicomonas sp. OPT23]MRI33932.1 flagellar basal body rod protein FlgC [Endozoicomonas sp. OPT23]
MSLNSIYSIAGSSMAAQTTRLNTIAGNMANAKNATSDPKEVYQARKPVFAEMLSSASSSLGSPVQVIGMSVSENQPVMALEPGNPMADDNGYVYYPNVNIIEEMSEMMMATRSYQTSVEVMSNARSMQEKLLTLGR